MSHQYLSRALPHHDHYNSKMPSFAADEPEWEERYLEELSNGGSVVATLYYQTIPPSYLLDRFTAADGDATRRLYYLASHLNVADTAVENW